MPTSFFARLEERAAAVDSLLCVGLDPHPQDLPENTAAAALDFCLNLINATFEIAAAYKPNIAFFEALGAEGISALQEVIEAVPDDIPVLLDAKRGDIASTATAYATAVFETYKADAVTINPYLGYDAIEPFIKDPQKGVFILCKTSNPGSKDLQDSHLQNGLMVYEQIAKLGQEWNANNNLGLVVGATHPEALARIRSITPDLWILAPGVGTQGGDLEAAINAGLRPDGMGMLVPVSRGISRAEDPKQAAQEIRDELNAARKNFQPAQKIQPITALASSLFESGCVQFGEFTLKSGLKSPIYIDLRRLSGFPKLLTQVARAYRPILDSLTFDRIAPLPYAALPIGTAISIQGNWPMIYPRKEEKNYGTKASIEGIYQSGEKVVVVDDLTTTGGSKFEAIEKLTQADLLVEDVVVLIDRESGAQEALAREGLKLHAVFTLTQLVDHLFSQGKINQEEVSAVKDFISQTKN